MYCVLCTVYCVLCTVYYPTVQYSLLPLVGGAGAGTVHPVVLLVRVLVQLLPAVIEGGLDAAHAGDGVHGGLGGAEAGVVAQPVRGERLRGGTGGTSAPATLHADDGVRGGRGGQVVLVRGGGAGGGAGDHRYRVGQAGHGGVSLDQRPAGAGLVGPALTRPRHFERRVHIEVLGPGGGAPGAGQCDGGVQGTQGTGQLCGGRGWMDGGRQRGLWPGRRCGGSAREGGQADTDQGTLRLTCPHISVHNLLLCRAGA